MSTKKTDFEAALKQLETLVNDLEKGDMSLEQSLKAFEQGVKLTRDCQDKLAKAELKVQQLSGNQLTAFHEEAE